MYQIVAETAVWSVSVSSLKQQKDQMELLIDSHPIGKYLLLLLATRTAITHNNK